MVWEGKDAVKTGRMMLGATNPLASLPGTSKSSNSSNLLEIAQNVVESSLTCSLTLSLHSIQSEVTTVSTWAAMFAT